MELVDVSLTAIPYSLRLARMRPRTARIARIPAKLSAAIVGNDSSRNSFTDGIEKPRPAKLRNRSIPMAEAWIQPCFDFTLIPSSKQPV